MGDKPMKNDLVDAFHGNPAARFSVRCTASGVISGEQARHAKEPTAQLEPFCGDPYDSKVTDSRAMAVSRDKNRADTCRQLHAAVGPARSRISIVVSEQETVTLPRVPVARRFAMKRE
jgi:hypothetical protein